MQTNMIIAVLATLFSLIGANYISLVAVRAGSPVHLQPINANGDRLWIGKPTTSYCPPAAKQQGLCSSVDDYTNFVASQNGELEMGALVPGGQQVYIDPECAAVCYTSPHSADMPAGAILTGWELSQGPSYGFLGWNDPSTGAGGFFACSNTGNVTLPPWQIFVALGGNSFGSDCLGFDILTANETTPAAWEYL